MEKLVEVDKDVRIELYTLGNLNEPQLLEINNTNSVETSNYNSKIPTRIFVHGFLSHGTLTKVFIKGIAFELFISLFKSIKYFAIW